jgi:glucosamine-phosphate N-acetyltransferase
MMDEIKYGDIREVIKEWELYIEKIKSEYIGLLSNLSKVGEIEDYKFMNIIRDISEMGIIYIAYIIPENEKKKIKIIGTGTVIYEPKIIRGGRSVARIEDIVVLEEYRGRGIAKNIINYLIRISKERTKEEEERYKYNRMMQYKIYKIILVCSEEYKKFYNKFGFSEKDKNLVLYI